GIHQNASIKLQLNFKIFDGGLRSATIRRQAAKVRELEAKDARIKREIIQTVRKSYNNLLTTIQQLEITETEIQANAELEKLRQKQFESGDIDITLLVESQERIFTALTKKIRLESERVNATFDILRTTAD